MKGKTLALQPTSTQWRALDLLALALRPDWAANKPGPTWYETVQNNTVVHAESFDHAVQALIAYCNETKDGKYVMRTPNLFTEDGKHWEAARPRVTHENPREPCPDHKLDRNNRWSCIGCKSEIKAGMRPADKLGQPWTPQEEAATIDQSSKEDNQCDTVSS